MVYNLHHNHSLGDFTIKNFQFKDWHENVVENWIFRCGQLIVEIFKDDSNELDDGDYEWTECQRTQIVPSIFFKTSIFKFFLTAILNFFVVYLNFLVLIRSSWNYL